VQPENGVESRHLKGRHVSAATHTIVDLVVDVLETAKGTWAGAWIPPVEAEGIKVAVRQQQQADIATQRSQLVGQDRGDPRVLRTA